MSYFGFLGHFEKDRVFIGWLSKKPYGTGSPGLEPWHTEPMGIAQLPWCGQCMELFMAVNFTPSCVPRLPVNALEMAPTWAQSTRKPEEASWERTNQQRHRGKWLPEHPSVTGTQIWFCGYHCRGQSGAAIPTHNPCLGSRVRGLCHWLTVWHQTVMSFLDVSLWLKWAEWNSGSEGPSRSLSPWFHVW